jgi:hypothetical protein
MVDIDKFFNENYNWLKSITQSNIYKYNSFNKNVDECITLMYLHLLKNKDKIKTEDDILDFCGQYSIKNTYWANSEFNKISKSNSKLSLVDDWCGYDREIIDVANIEEWYDEKYNYINEFIKTISEPWEKVYAIVYFNFVKKGIKPSVRKLKEHFNIGHGPSQKIKKEFEMKLSNWLKTKA